MKKDSSIADTKYLNHLGKIKKEIKEKKSTVMLIKKCIIINWELINQVIHWFLIALIIHSGCLVKNLFSPTKLFNPIYKTGHDVSDCHNYLFVYISDSCDPKNQVYYCELSGDKAGFNKDSPGRLTLTPLVDHFEAEYDYIANDGTLFYFKTNKNAPKNKIITIDLTKPQPENWKVLIDEHKDDVLASVFCVNKDKLVLAYMHDVKDVMYLHQLTTGERIRQIDLEVGTINGFSYRRNDDEFFYGFTSFLTPSAVYRYSFAKQESTLFRRSEVKGFNPDLFTTQQVFYNSKDGTKIPLFIVHKKGIELDGNNPSKFPPFFF